MRVWESIWTFGHLLLVGFSMNCGCMYIVGNVSSGSFEFCFVKLFKRPTVRRCLHLHLVVFERISMSLRTFSSPQKRCRSMGPVERGGTSLSVGPSDRPWVTRSPTFAPVAPTSGAPTAPATAWYPCSGTLTRRHAMWTRPRARGRTWSMFLQACQIHGNSIILVILGEIHMVDLERFAKSLSIGTTWSWGQAKTKSLVHIFQLWGAGH